MGAGASQQDKAELQSCFGAFVASKGRGDGLSAAGFEALMAERAPLLYCKAEETGDVASAARALRVQFAAAREKLHPSDAPPEPDARARAAAAASRALAARYDWAKDLPTNLQRGLVAGMLQSHPLRLVRFSLDNTEVVALFDSGAERSAMASETADACGLRGLIDDSFSRTVKGIGTAQGLGRVHYCEISITGVTFKAAFDVLRWPENVEFAAIIGLDLMVKGKAIINVPASTVRLINHDGLAANVPLDYPKEKDELERVRAAMIAKDAARAASVASTAPPGDRVDDADAFLADDRRKKPPKPPAAADPPSSPPSSVAAEDAAAKRSAVQEAFARNAARNAAKPQKASPTKMSVRQLKAELETRGVDVSRAVERTDLEVLLANARNVAP